MAKEEQVNTSPKLSGEYRAIDNRFRRDIALVEARPKLETAGLIAWAVLDAVLILIFLLGVIIYLVSGMFTEARSIASVLRNSGASHEQVLRTTPIDLEFGDVKSTSVTTGRYDIYASVENFNEDWYATFDYVFSYDDGVTEVYPSFILPDEQKTLVALNIEAARRPAGARLTLENLAWQRVNKHLIPNTAEFLAERANITVDQATYTKDLLVGNEQVGSSKIVLTNRTAYSYWEPEFLVKLMRGNTIMMATKLVVPEFASGETRELEVRWFGAVPATGTLSIETHIPYFDSQAYMDPGDETGLDVRR